MEEVANQSDLSVKELAELKPLRFRQGDIDENGKPVRSPELPLNHKVVAIVTYGEDDSKLIACDGLEEMQSLHALHKEMRSVLSVDWFSAPRQ